ncbi:PRC-barrel domain containing protein [Streptomyces sp. NPDC004288]|uniref:PRC-barrel domain containing protein n=1 Tax=unclassified Streptomyces TaxID=2593676 RepID=UPI002E766915|nr:PRC-barrel domain containing protein [Streptomyces sp. SP18ES09]MEE1820279.1 PRC-barrel domain containing protein [Streptomyces sp. SP18ES09]
MNDHVWTFNADSGHLAGTDLTGWRVEAADGHIGKVDRHSDEVDDAYLVVDTGVWIFGKEVLIPASAVIRIDLVEQTVHLGLVKEQVKDSPEFIPEKHLADLQYREEIGQYYHTGGPFPGGSGAF